MQTVQQLEAILRCPECSELRMIAEQGLICPNGHGRTTCYDLLPVEVEIGEITIYQTVRGKKAELVFRILSKTFKHLVVVEGKGATRVQVSTTKSYKKRCTKKHGYQTLPGIDDETDSTTDKQNAKDVS